MVSRSLVCFAVVAIALFMAVSSAQASTHHRRVRRQSDSTDNSTTSNATTTTAAPMCGKKACTTKKPTTTKGPQCLSSKMGTVKACCNATAKPLFTDAQLNACNKKNKKLNDWTSIFQLQGMMLQKPDAKKNKTQDVPSFDHKDFVKYVTGTLCPAAEFATCLLTNNSLISNGTLNSTAIAAFLAATQTDPAYLEALAGFGAQAEDLAAMINPNITLITCPGKGKELPKTFSIAPLVLLQGVQGLLIESCPGPLNSTKTIKTCNLLLRDYMFCSGIIMEKIFTELPQTPERSPFKRAAAVAKSRRAI